MAEWKHSPKVITMTVRQIRDFLDSAITKYKDFEDFNVVGGNNVKLFTSNRQFQNVKKTGVGETTILKFLCKPWKQWMIQDFLQDKIDKCKDFEDFRSGGDARPIFDSEPQFRSIKDK
jgi:hypothetical protein